MQKGFSCVKTIFLLLYDDMLHTQKIWLKEMNNTHYNASQKRVWYVKANTIVLIFLESLMLEVLLPLSLTKYY